MRWKTLFLSAAAGCAVLMAASCSTLVVHRSKGPKIGPPAHAPAHGCRRKQHQAVELTYDSASGVYVVVGLEKHYYLDGTYYRFGEDGWQVSVTLEGGWELISEDSVPPGLRGKYKAKQVSKAHPGRGRGLWQKSK